MFINKAVFGCKKTKVSVNCTIYPVTVADRSSGHEGIMWKVELLLTSRNMVHLHYHSLVSLRNAQPLCMKYFKIYQF